MPSAASLGVESVLDIVSETFGLVGVTRGSEYKIPCPNPDHPDTSPSCGVNLDTGFWHCFACGVGGDLTDLGALVLGRPVADVGRMLAPTSPEARLMAVQRKLARLAYRQPRRKRAVALPEHPPLGSHPDLHKRLFTTATLDRWGFGWVDEQQLTSKAGKHFIIKNSIAIPITDTSGTLISWCYRRTTASPEWQPRYLYSTGTEISEVWFGLRHHARADAVTIVEGALDAVWLDQCGFPALALLGSAMGDRKIRWLQQYKLIYLLPDYDSAGVQWQSRIVDMLGSRMPIRLCQYRSWMAKKSPEPSGAFRRAHDPEELTAVDLEIAHATAPYVTAARARQLDPR